MGEPGLRHAAGKPHPENPVPVIPALWSLYGRQEPGEPWKRDFIAPITSVTPILPVQAISLGPASRSCFSSVARGSWSLSISLTRVPSTITSSAVPSGSGKIVSGQLHRLQLLRLPEPWFASSISAASYKKMANMLGARYLDFQPETTDLPEPLHLISGSRTRN